MTYEQLLVHGDQLFEGGAQVPAIQTWAEAVRQDPTRKEALTKLGMAYRDMGDAEGAVQILQRAAEIDQDDAYVRLMLGITFYDHGNYEGAEHYLRQAVAVIDSYLEKARTAVQTPEVTQTIMELSATRLEAIELIQAAESSVAA